MKKPLTVKTLEQARSEFSKHWKPTQKTEKISLKTAPGRILAENVKSRIELPPFNRSVYDGYAVRAEDTYGAEEDDPVELRLEGEIHAGENPQIDVQKGSCTKIATGAVIPNNADSVVMVEDADERKKTVLIRRAVTPKQNISEKGSEIKKGQTIAEAGRKISPQVHGALIAAGVREVKVIKKPTAGVISSGEEVVTPDEEIQPGQLYDVNGPAICDSVRLSGGQPYYLGIVGDEINEIKKVLGDAVSNFDTVITSGGSSAGSKDIIPEAINELGEPGVIIHGLAQKPGKPTVMALIDNNPIFGLPGYPVSALMVFDQLFAPYIREMAGVREPERRSVEAKLSRKVLSARGRRELVPTSIEKNKNELIARPLRKGSGAITSLANADGYLSVPINLEIIEKGETVTVKLFGGENLG